MKSAKLMALYKIKWKSTANTYVVSSDMDMEAIKSTVREYDYRADDIVDIERMFLPSFDGDTLRDNEYAYMFYDLKFL